MKKKIIIFSVSLFLLAGIISICSYQINTGEFVVVTQFGKPLERSQEPGLYFKLPLPVQTVTRIDSRMQLYQSRLIEYLTGDKKNVIVRLYACWKVEDPLQFYASVGTVQNAEQKLDDILCALTGATLGDYSMKNLFSTEKEDVKIMEMEDLIATGAAEKMKKSYGIGVVSVGFSRFALPEDNTRSVYNRMRAERATIANQYRARGEEEAGKIKAEADKEKSGILALAYAEAEKVKGAGDAEAASIYAKAYSKNVAFFELLKTMDSYKKIFNEKTTLVLSSDTDLLKYLNGDTPAKGKAK